MSRAGQLQRAGCAVLALNLLNYHLHQHANFRTPQESLLVEAAAKMKRLRLLLLFWTVILATTVGSDQTSALAQSGSPVRIIVPFDPGAAVDVVARILARAVGAVGPARHRRESAGRLHDRRRAVCRQQRAGRRYIAAVPGRVVHDPTAPVRQSV